MKTRNVVTILSTLALGLLAACDGPWNMSVDPVASNARKLWVSCFLVANQPFDTLWIEEPNTLVDAYDSTKSGYDADKSRVLVVRSDSADTVHYERSPDNLRAWIPTAADRSKRVAAGASYRFLATLERKSGGTDTLSARTELPRSYGIDDLAWAPLASFHPSLAEGLPVSSLFKAKDDPAYAARLLDSLQAIHRLPLPDDSLAALLTAYFSGQNVYRPLHRGDSIWYISDDTPVKDFNGNTTPRYSSQLLFIQNTDRQRFGGYLITLGYDPSKSVIQSPIARQFMEALGRKDVDSADMYPVEAIIPADIQPKVASDRRGFPDTVQVANLSWNFTGRNTFHAYSIDSLYYEYYRGIGRSSNSTLRYSNVKGGDGYFSGAVVDSFHVFVNATKYTYSIDALRKAWCEKAREDARKNGKTWIPAGRCSDIS